MRWNKRARALRNLGVDVVNNLIVRKGLILHEDLNMCEGSNLSTETCDVVLQDQARVHTRCWLSHTNVMRIHVFTEEPHRTISHDDPEFIANLTLIRKPIERGSYLKINRREDPHDFQTNYYSSLKKEKWLTERLLTFNVEPLNDLYMDSIS